MISKGLASAADRSAATAAGLALSAVAAIAGCGTDRSSSPSAPESAAPAPIPTLGALESAVPENPLKNAYFGETHVHTSFSLDAYIGGNRITPDGAYRFAKGEDVTVNGQRHNIGRPE